MKTRFRPNIEPTLPPVTMNIAITSVYRVIAVWIPVTAVPTSFGDRRDRNVHDRTVHKHHKLSGCQRRKNEPDARPSARLCIHAGRLQAAQDWDPADAGSLLQGHAIRAATHRNRGMDVEAIADRHRTPLTTVRRGSLAVLTCWPGMSAIGSMSELLAWRQLM